MAFGVMTVFVIVPIENSDTNGECISRIMLKQAGVVQLVERNLAKVEVAGSSPVSRSNNHLLINEYFSESSSVGRAWRSQR
jgi:hypothetical protein